MKTSNFKLGTWNLRWAVVALVLIACNDCTAQIQQAWAAHYNNGILNGTNQAVKMALDTAGNIYITGFSQNTNTNLGYVTIKYAANGNQLWAARYDSTNYPAATPAGLVLDSNNNVVVTGSALTIKYGTNGNQLWTAPYDGAGIAMDPGGNAVVTGFDSGFNAVKISPTGTNLWLSAYEEPLGPALSQTVAADSSSNVYVAGENTYSCYSEGPAHGCYVDLLLAKYDQNGNQLWTAQNIQASDGSIQVAGMALDGAENLYLVVNGTGPGSGFQTFSYSSEGTWLWTAFPDNGIGPAKGLALDTNTNVFLTGENPYALSDEGFLYYYTSFKVNALGTSMWTNYFPQPSFGSSAATSIAADAADNVCVTGYSLGANSNNDIVTIKYDQNGNQIWLQRYTSPGNGNAAGNAIAVDNNGNVYVTGYDTTAQGGTEIITIKYSPVVLQRRSDGTVLLQAQGSPGEAFDIEASQDLLNWLNLGSVLTDSNGLMQFDDTNAPAYPFRFYSTNPQ